MLSTLTSWPMLTLSWIAFTAAAQLAAPAAPCFGQSRERAARPCAVFWPSREEPREAVRGYGHGFHRMTVRAQGDHLLGIITAAKG
jgi:hypothetical protein